MRQPKAWKALVAGRLAGQQDHHQAEEQAEGRRHLDEAGVEAAPSGRGVLGHVGRRAAVLAAQGQALDQAHDHQGDRRGDADAGVAGQQADHEGRQAHQQHGDQEGVLAAPQVAQPAEHQGPERPHREAGGEGQQGENIAGGLVDPREEMLGDIGGQRAVEVEVVPLEHRADRGGSDDQGVLAPDGATVLGALHRFRGVASHSHLPRRRLRRSNSVTATIMTGVRGVGERLNMNRTKAEALARKNLHRPILRDETGGQDPR
jgi:hypothetical protein